MKLLLLSKWNRIDAKNKNVLNDDDYYPIKLEYNVLFEDKIINGTVYNIVIYDSSNNIISYGVQDKINNKLYHMNSLAGCHFNINDNIIKWTMLGAGFPYIWSYKGVLSE